MASKKDLTENWTHIYVNVTLFANITKVCSSLRFFRTLPEPFEVLFGMLPMAAVRDFGRIGQLKASVFLVLCFLTAIKSKVPPRGWWCVCFGRSRRMVCSGRWRGWIILLLTTVGCSQFAVELHVVVVATSCGHSTGCGRHDAMKNVSCTYVVG